MWNERIHDGDRCGNEGCDLQCAVTGRQGNRATAMHVHLRAQIVAVGRARRIVIGGAGLQVRIGARDGCDMMDMHARVPMHEVLIGGHGRQIAARAAGENRNSKRNM